MDPKKRENGPIDPGMVPIDQKYPSVFKMGSKSKTGPKLEELEPNYDFFWYPPWNPRTHIFRGSKFQIAISSLGGPKIEKTSFSS